MFKVTLLIVVLFVLSMNQAVMAKSRVTAVEDKAGFTLTDTNPVLLDEYLLFQTTADEGVILWSQNTGTNDRASLFEGQIADFQVPNGYTSMSKQLLRNNNLVYFLVGENFGVKQMWRTDGTENGTFQLDSPAIYKGLVSSQGLVFSQGNDGQIIATDGENVMSHQFTFPSTESICAFGLNDLITLDYDSSNATTFLKRSKDGVVTDIPVPGGNDFFTIDSKNMWRLGDVCFIGLFRNGETPEVMMVSESGNVHKLSEIYNTAGMRHIFKFDDRIYARGNNQIIRLNESLNGVDKSFTFSDNLSVYDSELLNDYIIVKTTVPNVSPQINITHFFDTDLNELSELGGAFVPVPEYYQTANGPYYLTTKRSIDSYNSLLAEDVGMESVVLSIKDAFVDDVTSHEDKQQIFMLLRDKVTDKRSIAMMSDSPGIGKSISGLWHDPEVLNQGMSVHTGERADGSKYVFVTVYTFKDGAPFWLAGVSDISPPQTSIEMVLGDYKDSNMFETGTVPTEHVFGTMSLEMTSCDQLKAILTSDQTNLVLDLSRIDNVQHNHFCLNN